MRTDYTFQSEKTRRLNFARDSKLSKTDCKTAEQRCPVLKKNLWKYLLFICFIVLSESHTNFNAIELKSPRFLRAQISTIMTIPLGKRKIRSLFLIRNPPKTDSTIMEGKRCPGLGEKYLEVSGVYTPFPSSYMPKCLETILR